MLAGASPTIIQKGVVGRHQQTWKLREHHLLSTDHSDSDSGIDMDIDDVTPLRAGDPLRSYFPTGTQLREHKEGLTVQDSESTEVRRYYRVSTSSTPKSDTDEPRARVRDIILTGEVSYILFFLLHLVSPFIGTFCLGSVQPSRTRKAMRWFYKPFKGLCLLSPDH